MARLKKIDQGRDIRLVTVLDDLINFHSRGILLDSFLPHIYLVRKTKYVGIIKKGSSFFSSFRISRFVVFPSGTM